MRTLLISAACLFLAPSAPAQSHTEAPPSWFSFGAGASTGRSAAGLGGVALQIVQPAGLGPSIVQVGASVSETSGGFFLRQRDGLTEAHVAVGVAAQTGPLRVAVVAGPSVGRAALAETRIVDGVERRIGLTSRILPGAYGSVQGVVALNSRLGISAEAFGLANADLPTAGVRVGLVVGNL